MVIGAIVVMNTMLLSLVERYREFGVLRAVGWSRRRVVGLVLGEALALSLGGVAVGVGLAYVLRRGQIGVDLIALLALAGALALGELLAGAIIALMVTSGDAARTVRPGAGQAGAVGAAVGGAHGCVPGR